MTNPFIILFEKNKATFDRGFPIIAAETPPYHSPQNCDSDCDDNGDDSDYDEVGFELGRKQKQSFVCAEYPSPKDLGSGVFPNRRIVMQITIQQICLPKILRMKGYMRGFIEYLLGLPGVEAVQLQAVMNPSLRNKLLPDPKWVCQEFPDNRDFNSSFVLFKNSQ